MTNSEWVPEVGKACEYSFTMFQEDKSIDMRDTVTFIGMDGMRAVIRTSRGDYTSTSQSCLRPIPTDEDRAAEQLMLDATLMRVQAERVIAAGYRKQPPEPPEDLTDPANWRAGDVVVAIYSGLDITKGNFYSLFMSPEGELVFIDDVDDEREAKHHAHLVTFHQRP